MTTNIRKLLNRGDEFSIEYGQLIVHPASGMNVPLDWYQEHSKAIIREILMALGMEAYEYISHKTGLYGHHKAPGLTLQLRSAVKGEDAYTIFNVSLTRSRSTKAGKKGAPLPTGHFRIGKKCHFYSFWQSTGLPTPKRLAALHDYVGNLAGIWFVADQSEDRKGRLSSGGIRPLSVSARDIHNAFLPDRSRTVLGQTPDNLQTKIPDKELAPSRRESGLQPESATSQNSHGKTVIRRYGDKRSDTDKFNTTSPRIHVDPKNQTVDEWLEDYSRPGDES
ncbi:hypothetical protein ACLUTX_12825 [Enterobacterales bacterium AE_CKDN230030158-1A_HGKHYDSX7]